MFEEMDVKVLIQSSRLSGQKKYWMKKLAADMVKTEILPGNPGAPMTRKDSGKVDICLADELCRKVLKLSKESDLSIYIILLAAMKILIYRYANNNDITVAAPIYRKKVSPETINSCLFIRDQVKGEMSFKELLIQVRQSVLDAHENQDYPFDKIIEDLFDNPREQIDVNISSIFCSFKNIHANVKIKKLEMKLSFIFEKENGKIRGYILFDGFTYEEEFIKQVSGHFSNILRNSLEDINGKISQIPFLSAVEVEQLIYGFNNNKAGFSRDRTIYQLVEKNAARIPDHIALDWQDHRLTYRELNKQANQLAWILRESGIQRDRLVAVLLDRSLEMAVGILAAWKAGGAYIPLDTQYPIKRIIDILQDSGAPVLFTRWKYIHLDFHDSYQGKIVMPHRDDRRVSKKNTNNLNFEMDMNGLAYVIYTSGSTGKPKGVMVEHIGMMNHIQAKINELQITSRSIIAQNASHTFDISVWQFFTALTGGGRTVIYSNRLILEPQQFISKIIADRVTVLEVVPSYLSVMLDSLDLNFRPLCFLHYLLVTGETLKPKLVKKWFEKYPHIKMVNAYGPTEASDDITHYAMDKAPDSNTIPIGKTVQNLNIYILNETMNLCPIGIKGEICVSGVGVGRGYLNDIEKTDNAFVEERYAGKRGGRLYKAGDLGRWLPDGNIEFFGRKDHQVKIRGFRIELGEIENKLVGHPDIVEAVVVDKEDEKGNKFLCAYIVSVKEVDESKLREYLSKSLPNYIIPSYFIQLERVPLTSNGKVDRRSLPEPELKKGDNYEAPRNQIEDRLAGIWSEVLEIDKSSIGIHDNFFEMGGHSLRATILAGKLHKAFNVKVPLAEIFKTSTISGISGYVKKAKEEKYSAITLVEKKEYYPLSSAQKRLYFLQQMDANSTTYNIPLVLSLAKAIDIHKMESAIKNLIIRHESLRTSFEPVKGIPVQRIHEPGDIDFTFDYYKSNEREAQTIVNDYVKPFDLTRAPLLRSGVIELPDGSYAWMVDIHHIVSDGVSEIILAEDFLSQYESIGLEPLKIQYKDFSQWQNQLFASGLIKNQEDYWLGVLADPGEIPRLNLPADYRRPNVFTFEGGSYQFGLEGEVAREFKAHGARHRATLFMNFLAVLNILFYKYTGQTDIVIGCGIAGRPHADLQSVIGMFVNMLAMRNNPEGEKTCESFLEEVTSGSVKAFENQDVQFEELVEKLELPRDPSRNPLFDISMVVQNFRQVDRRVSNRERGNRTDRTGMMDILHTGAGIQRTFTYENINSRFDMTFLITEGEDDIRVFIEYYTGIYSETFIRRLAAHLERVIKAVVENPAARLKDISILSEEEKTQILETFNDTRSDYPADKTIHELFEEQAAATPYGVSVVGSRQYEVSSKNRTDETVQLTYRELNKRSDQVAWRLQERGIQTDIIVGIKMERCVEMIIGILGILKAGGAYLPIDPEYPQERIDYMLKDSGAKILLTELPEGPKHHHSSFIIHNCNNLAYVLYTSGSTGSPKGVTVIHRNVLRLVKNTNFITFQPGGHLLQTGAMVFDASTFEIWGTLLNGLQLYLVGKEEILTADRLEENIRKFDIGIMWMTSPLFNQIVQADVDVFYGLRYFLVGGDVLSPYHINRLRTHLPGLNVINGYGPTENTTFSTTFLIDKEYDNRIPIGKPIANSTAYILDNHFNLQPVGMPGELVVGGDGVSRGYLNNPELTAERFIGFSLNTRFYRTGDSARWLPDGNIEFLGRIDHQVKIRGFRVELGEIEARLLTHRGVKEAIVLARGDRDNNQYLCAYFVGGTDSEGPLETSILRGYLSQSLPAYMIPAHFVRLEKLPLTANGKVNRRALPEPGSKVDSTYVPPGDEVEKQLALVWAEVLAHPSPGIHDNFFELGGHSLNATVMVTKIHKVLDVKVPLGEVFKSPTIRELSTYIKGTAKEKYAEIVPVEKKEYYPLSPAQKRLYFIQRMDGNSTAYNMPLVLSPGKNTDIDKVESAINKLIVRHESLRTSFESVKGVLVQRIHEPESIDFSVDYYEGDETEAQRIINHYIQPFDLARAPLLRSGLIKLPGGSHAWIVDIHHIISDGTSQTVLAEDFLSLYEGAGLEPLGIQYKDFSQWQEHLFQSGRIKAQEDYWLGLFADHGDIPRLDLATGSRRPGIFTFEGGRYEFVLEDQEAGEFKAHGARHGATLFMNFLALLNILFYKYTGRQDIIIGTGIAGRPHADLQSVIGMFVNMLVMRNYPHGKQTYESFLEQVAANSVKSFENQDVQFEALVEKLELPKDLSRNPLFDISMVVQNFRQMAKGKRLSNQEPGRNSSGTLPTAVESGQTFAHEKINSKFDMTFSVTEREDDIQVAIEYYTAIFEETFIRRLVSHLKRIIKAVVENPAARLKDISILSEEEKIQLLEIFNDTQSDYPRDKTIHELFEEQVAATPYGVALVGSENRTGGMMHLTYRELNERSDQVVRWLQKRGVQPDTIVGIQMERCVEMIIGIMGILKAGGAYLPIDPEYPQERIDYMLKDSNAKMLLTGLSEGRGFHHSSLIDHHSSSLAYVIYTSGTTGKPKGVMTCHYNVTRVVRNTNYIDIKPEDRILQLSNYAFDGSVFDIYGALLNGSTLVLVKKDDVLAVNSLAAKIKREAITVFFLTTALFNTLVDIDIGCFADVRKVLFGGERVSVEHSIRALEYLGKNRIIHVYGPTETTVYATYYFIDEIAGKAGTIPIGKPISNTTVCILSPNMKPVPIGLNGEVYIGGNGTARGYLNRPELTAEKFVSAPASSRKPQPGGTKKGTSKKETPYSPTHQLTNSTIYRTGDLARWLPDGNIEFLGRMDNQVKIRGFRVELGEIESRLQGIPRIKEACVIDREKRSGEKYLCAYFVQEKPLDPLNPTEVRNILGKHLPDYMVPAHLIPLEQIPLTPNGKIDKQALLALEFTPTTDYVAPKNKTEKIIAGIWREVLELEKVGANDNFFEAGGTSLDVIKVSTRIKEALNRDIPVVHIFQYPTVSALAGYFDREETGSDFAGDDRGKAVQRGKEKRKIRSQKKRRKK